LSQWRADEILIILSDFWGHFLLLRTTLTWNQGHYRQQRQLLHA